MYGRYLTLLGLAGLLLGAAEPGGGTLAGVRALEGVAPEPVRFVYHRELDGTGRIYLELPSGEAYVGTYLRLSGEWSPSRVERIFARWKQVEFDRFEVGPTGQPWEREQSALERFRRRHRKRVVATLISDRGASMRCSFALDAYERGLPGGASGRCQLTDGSVIDLARSAEPPDEAKAR